jgi:hypothetical protein
MNIDGYKVSNKEQELKDLREMSQSIYQLSEAIDEVYSELDQKYGFSAVDALQDLVLEIDRKIEELIESTLQYDG